MPRSHMKAASRAAKVPQVRLPRSKFDLSHKHATMFDMGLLIPIIWDEIYPGDTFNMDMSALVRMNTPLVPLMDNLWLETFFFFIPNRLIWTNWQKFCGEQEDPGDSTAYTVPQQTPTATGYVAGRVEDFLGIPPGVVTTTTSWTHSALPVRAYFRVWNEWFRDENLRDSLDERGSSGSPDYGDGPQTAVTGGAWPQARGKRHDYFTSCLPWPQKGTAIDLPLGTSAPVMGVAGQTPTFVGSVAAGSSTLNSQSAAANADLYISSVGAAWAVGETANWSAVNQGLEADLSSATAATINELRQAFMVQQMLERDARSGTRYVEVLKAHFGVTSPDFRLMRTEYLGGGRSPVVINPVAQTSETNTTEQGTLTGVGTSTAFNHGFVKSFVEHGILLGLACVSADLTYQQGLDRKWSRSTRYDYFWPALQHLGEQSVLSKELYLDDHADDESVFGYQERYAELRQGISRVSNTFRSSHASTLEIWHLAQDFATRPLLDSDFINENQLDLDRCVATPAEPHFKGDFYFDIKAARPIATYGIPGGMRF